MTESHTETEHTAGAREALRVIGDFWTLRIVAALGSSDMRFCALERALGDSNPATLTARLKKLEQHGVVRRCDKSGDILYSLTDAGQELRPIVASLQRISTKLAD